jgi:hypothetical protein
VPALRVAAGAAIARHRELADLPPALAKRLSYEHAAPRRLRSDRLPEPVRAELRELWDGIVADVYDEVGGLTRRDAFSRTQVLRALARISDRLLHAERVVIFAAVHHPMRSDTEWKHAAVAGAGGGGAALAEEVATFATAGTATTVAIVSAVAGEVLETYVSASARAMQYRRAQRPPDPAVVMVDLAEAAGYGESAGRRITGRVVHDAAEWLSERVLRRTVSRFSRGIVPLVGVAAGAGMSVANVRRVTKLPLRPVAADELGALARLLVDDPDPDAYAEARRRFVDEELPAVDSPDDDAAP